MASDNSGERSELRDLIDRLSTWLFIAAENGLFAIQNRDQEFQMIQDAIKRASQELVSDKPHSLAECNECVSCAIKSLSDVVYSKDHARWRFFNVYAGDIWLYLVGFLAFVFFIYFFDINTAISNRLHIPMIAVDAAIWGVIGGVLRGMWYLWTNINERQQRLVWRIWYFSCPFLGGILGALVYMLIIAGMLVLSQQTTSLGDQKGLNQQLVVMGFCALAGYNWEWAVKRFQKIGEMV